MNGMVTAAEMARSWGIDPKRFRRELRSQSFAWHGHNDRWKVPVGSSQHKEMELVLSNLVGHKPILKKKESERKNDSSSLFRISRDETWVIDLCDRVLGKNSIRQHQFDFLLGDPGKNGRRVRLPVDAFYSDFNLVVEYHERQHTEPVSIMDRRQTVSGVARGQQRRIYDERRRIMLPQNGYRLVVFDYTEFQQNANQRLRRDAQAQRNALKIISERLSTYLKQSE